MQLKYIQIKNQKGTAKKSIIFRERPKKYSKKLKETYIAKTKSILITGLHASGKTKEIQKIFANKEKIYKNKKFIWIAASDPLSDWFNKNIKAQDTQEFLNSLEDEDEKLAVIKDIRKQHIKIQNLINKTEKAILFIDDIDRLQGKKKEVAKDLIKVSSLVICTAKTENEIDKTIASMLHRKKYQEIALNSEASYDATNILFVMIILSMLATGNLAMAGIVMAGRYALKGKDIKR